MRSLCDWRDDWIRIRGFFDSLNLKVERDYHKAMEIVMERTTPDWGG